MDNRKKNPTFQCLSQFVFLSQTVRLCREHLSLQLFSEKIAVEAKL